MPRLRCSSADEIELGRYLLATPVAWLGEALLLGRAGAWHDKIADRDALGATATIFGNLGTAYARTIVGRETFLVRDVLPAVRAPVPPDGAFLADIEAKIASERAGRLVDRRLTMLERDGLAELADGNKRAIAIYEAAIARGPFTVVVVRLL